MEHGGDGLVIWYGDDDTPAPSGSVAPTSLLSVTVGVRPASLTNAVDVEYRVNGGATRLLSSRLVKDDLASGAQLFQAVFPYLAPGSIVEYAPSIRSLGRRVGPRLGGDRASSFHVDPVPSPDSVPAADIVPGHETHSEPAVGFRDAFPYTVKHLAQVQAHLSPAKNIGITPDGLRVNFEIIGGRVVGERFTATVETGGADALRIRDDGAGIVAVRTTLRTHDGAIVYAEYSGVLDLGEDGYRNAVHGRYPARPKVHLAPRFLCAAPAYAWLNRLQCFGIGYVTMEDLEVNYDLYAINLPEAEPGRMISIPF